MQPGQPAPISEKIGELRVGTRCSNIELTPGKGGQIGRAAGVYGTIVKKEGDLGAVQIKVPSGKLIEISSECRVFRGRVGNEEHRNRKIGKAGRNR